MRLRSEWGVGSELESQRNRNRDGYQYVPRPKFKISESGIESRAGTRIGATRLIKTNNKAGLFYRPTDTVLTTQRPKLKVIAVVHAARAGRAAGTGPVENNRRGATRPRRARREMQQCHIRRHRAPGGRRGARPPRERRSGCGSALRPSVPPRHNRDGMKWCEGGAAVHGALKIVFRPLKYVSHVVWVCSLTPVPRHKCLGSPTTFSARRAWTISPSRRHRVGLAQHSPDSRLAAENCETAIIATKLATVVNESQPAGLIEDCSNDYSMINARTATPSAELIASFPLDGVEWNFVFSIRRSGAASAARWSDSPASF
ncbi:hypothetical protein EVAR_59306_1 [Eumeta japonica]|uniref:Uncharacterized protein n=1 Tax=Eumeta variegata TaxID=151549 RepID=A0A4C1YCD0_EUMVA|nr:hypothetical protein EVAR_59306_1 [Eumeta japonica]